MKGPGDTAPHIQLHKDTELADPRTPLINAIDHELDEAEFNKKRGDIKAENLHRKNAKDRIDQLIRFEENAAENEALNSSKEDLVKLIDQASKEAYDAEKEHSKAKQKYYQPRDLTKAEREKNPQELGQDTHLIKLKIVQQLAEARARTFQRILEGRPE